jgi:hypothetical protein
LRFGKPEDLEKQMLLPAPFSKKWQNCTYWNSATNAG